MAASLIENRGVGRAQGAVSYRWGTDCMAWCLIKEAPTGIKEEWMPAGESEVCHMHKESVQFFYILEGEALMQINEQEYRLNSGDGILVQSGEWHWNYCLKTPGVRFLVISNQDINNDRIDRDSQARLSDNELVKSKAC